MESIFGIIVFVLFVALQVMADRKKGMKKGQKSHPVTAAAKPKNKPLMPVEQAGPRKRSPGEASYSSPIDKKIKPVRQDNVPKTVQPSETVVPNNQLVAAVGAPASPVLNHEDLRRAVLWSEILAKPRAMRKSIR